MRLSIYAAIAFVCVLGWAAFAQTPDAATARAFLASRQQAKSASATPPAARPLAFGYTLFQRAKDGVASRVNPAVNFVTGDATRWMFESNHNGYLYIFAASNDEPAALIFPDPHLEEGQNQVVAHVPYELPSRRNPDPKFHWFEFYGDPATEHLYLVLSRQPLPDVPAGEKLLSLCRNEASACPWKPTTEQWNKLRALNAPAQVTQNSATLGQNQLDNERDAADRTYGLRLEDPPPFAVKLNDSAATGTLFVTLDLIHK